MTQLGGVKERFGEEGFSSCFKAIEDYRWWGGKVLMWNRVSDCTKNRTEAGGDDVRGGGGRRAVAAGGSGRDIESREKQ